MGIFWERGVWGLLWRLLGISEQCVSFVGWCTWKFRHIYGLGVEELDRKRYQNSRHRPQYPRIISYLYQRISHRLSNPFHLLSSLFVIRLINTFLGVSLQKEVRLAGVFLDPYTNIHTSLQVETQLWIDSDLVCPFLSSLKIKPRPLLLHMRLPLPLHRIITLTPRPPNTLIHPPQLQCKPRT